MYRFRTLALGVILLAGMAAGSAHAGGWSVGIRFGGPIYVGAYYPYYRPYYYYPPYPVVVAAPPVVVGSVPVVQPAPVYQSASPPAVEEQLPAPRTVSPDALPSAPVPAVPMPVAPASATQPKPINQRQLDIDNSLRQLADRDARIREEAVMQLGRARAQRAIDPLAATLAGDSSAAVRDAAARALGLIGSPKALPALRRAAQVDADKDVRRSAQFSIEVVQVRADK
jgi:hypothetical protein